MAKKSKSKSKSKAKPKAKLLLSDLFHETLKDIYFAENKIIKTLPKMAKAAQSRDLKAAFTKHERETRGQVKRLEHVFKIIGKPVKGKTCDAINGIAEEGAEIMKDFKGMPALDAGLLAAAQAVEHYEISRYGTLRTWARKSACPMRQPARGHARRGKGDRSGADRHRQIRGQSGSRGKS